MLDPTRKCTNYWWYTGWWFGTFFIFPYIGNNNPNWLIFFRGIETTKQYKWDVGNQTGGFSPRKTLVDSGWNYKMRWNCLSPDVVGLSTGKSSVDPAARGWFFMNSALEFDPNSAQHPAGMAGMAGMPAAVPSHDHSNNLSIQVSMLPAQIKVFLDWKAAQIRLIWLVVSTFFKYVVSSARDDDSNSSMCLRSVEACWNHQSDNAKSEGHESCMSVPFFSVCRLAVYFLWFMPLFVSHDTICLGCLCNLLYLVGTIGTAGMFNHLKTLFLVGQKPACLFSAHV